MTAHLHNKLTRLVLTLSVFSAPALAEQLCHSAIPKSTPTSQFTINSDGTVLDTKTNLMWKQCYHGLSGSDCTTGTASFGTWAESLAAAESSTFAGYGDWRLPNIKELASIIEVACEGHVNTTVFPNDLNWRFWSSSLAANENNRALTTYDGWIQELRRLSDGYIRLVRDPD